MNDNSEAHNLGQIVRLLHLAPVTFRPGLPYHFLGGITTETNFDLILSFDDECFQIIIFLLVLAWYISSSLKNRINLQRIILTSK